MQYAHGVPWCAGLWAHQGFPISWTLSGWRYKLSRKDLGIRGYHEYLAAKWDVDGQDGNKIEQIDERRKMVAARLGPAETEMDMIKMYLGRFCVRVLLRK